MLKCRSFIPLLAACLIALSSCDNRDKVSEADSQQLYIGEDIAIADTQYGRVRGFILRGIYHFRGIPYGAPTGGENRFMPPREPEPWDGVRLALNYGDMAPQEITYDSEDCLRLNVWTPGIADGGKRPVLVYFHGGGFFNGSALEKDGYGGENLARYGDVVVCSVNHRLNAFGYTDLAKVGGEKYIHIKVHVPLPNVNKPNQLLEQHKDKTLADPL